MKLLVDGVAFQSAVSDSARVWQSILPLLAVQDDLEIMVLDRGGMPTLEGVMRIPFPTYKHLYTADDSELIQRFCDFYAIDVFTSTQHITPLSTGETVPAHDWQETNFKLVAAAARPAPTLEINGDWQRLNGFLAEQDPVPAVGMYSPFYWNSGDTCQIRVRVATGGGARTLHLALAAGMRDQRVSLVVAGRTYDWCTLLTGPIGHVERRAWLVDGQPGTSTSPW